MATQNTSNTRAFIESQQYSQFILENLHDGLLPEAFYRDVSDFSHGETLNIKTVGTVTLQEVTEGAPIVYNAIDSGTVTLAMTDYVGDGWAITDKLRMDGNQVEALSAQRAMESTRAFQEYFETRQFAVLDAAQDKTGDVNLINGRPHRWVAGGAAATSRNMTLDDFIAMKLAFDKANAPQAGRIAIVDPIVEASLNSITNLVNVSNNPMFEGMVTEGFARDHKFIRNIFGWDIWTSNRLPILTATEGLDASTYGLANDTAEIGDVVNQFMCVASDQTKAGMVAWRQKPAVEGERNKDEAQDEFVTRGYLGLGAQRVDTLGCIITSASTY
jgi:hypothetical protein